MVDKWVASKVFVMVVEMVADLVYGLADDLAEMKDGRMAVTMDVMMALLMADSWDA